MEKVIILHNSAEDYFVHLFEQNRVSLTTKNDQTYFFIRNTVIDKAKEAGRSATPQSLQKIGFQLYDNMWERPILEPKDRLIAILNQECKAEALRKFREDDLNFNDFIAKKPETESLKTQSSGYSSNGDSTKPNLIKNNTNSANNVENIQRDKDSSLPPHNSIINAEAAHEYKAFNPSKSLSSNTRNIDPAILSANIRSFLGKVFNNVTTPEVTKNLNILKGFTAAWKGKNTIPNIKLLVSVARYFNFSLDYIVFHGEFKLVNFRCVTFEEDKLKKRIAQVLKNIDDAKYNKIIKTLNYDTAARDLKRWENQEATPDIISIALIAAITNTSLDYFLLGYKANNPLEVLHLFFQDSKLITNS